ncbi:hypothetical protein [Mastigocoleus testarum]|nr:hypothetical protein [Mastigocoleus testarum]
MSFLHVDKIAVKLAFLYIKIAVDDLQQNSGVRRQESGVESAL